jgi:hypothetical protein
MESDLNKGAAVSRWTNEDLLYLLAFAVALLMRLAVLGLHPLTEHEAGFALQAWQAAHGESFVMVSHPAYIQLTGLLFFLFGSGDVLARLLPALAGSCVVLLPLALRQQLGRKAALVAAFGLALDPISIAISRQAGSPAMALGFLALAVYLWTQRRFLASGAAAGLLLLSGPSMVYGVLSLLVSGLIVRRSAAETLSPGLNKDDFRRFLFGAAAAILLPGTFFTNQPQGLAAMVQSIPDFLTGWLPGAAGVSLVQVLLALAVYQPFGLIFGILALLDQRRGSHKLDPQLAVLVLVPLAAVLLYPGRQVWMLMWVMIPIWLLAGRYLGEFLTLPEEEDRPFAYGEAAFYVVLLAYWWHNLAKLTTQAGLVVPEGYSLTDLWAFDPTARVYVIRLAVVFLVPLVLLAMSGLVSLGWRGNFFSHGAVWGLGVFLVFYLLVAAFGFSSGSDQLANELWLQGPGSGTIDEMVTAIEQISIQQTGTRDELELVYQIDSALLHWLFREMPNADYSPVAPENSLYAVVLNTEPDFGLTVGGQFYTGQHFSLFLRPDWSGGAAPPDFDRWLVYREAPLQSDRVYLWTRVDLFPLYQPAPLEPEE